MKMALRRQHASVSSQLAIAHMTGRNSSRGKAYEVLMIRAAYPVKTQTGFDPKSSSEVRTG